MICRVDRGAVRFWTRNQNDWTDKFPTLSKAAKLIPATSAILDGEVVVFDERGHTSFQKLQQTMGKGDAGFIYEVFDLIYLDGFSLTRTPLKDRKTLLKELISKIPGNSRLRYSDHIEGNGRAFFKQACAHGTQGIVSKLASSFYESGRSRNWLKVKCSKRQEFVIAGYTTSKKGMPGFGSLILGVYEKGKLVYSGRVGTGFTEKQRVELKKKLDKISRKTSPFGLQPIDPDLREAHWVHPKLVCEVAFTEWTSDGLIRHPSFQGLREDKRPEDVHRELPKNAR